MEQPKNRKRVVRGAQSTAYEGNQPPVTSGRKMESRGVKPSVRAAQNHARAEAERQTQLKKKKKKKRARNTLLVVLSLAVVCVVAFNSSLFSGGLGSLFAGIGTPSALKGKLTTFLVAGIGDDESERSSTNLTDIIMLVQINKVDQQINILQIPRDTYVGDITPTGKVNAIYNRDNSWNYHGMEGLSKRLHEMTALPIDHYVTMKMDGFKDIIDAIGGVEMDVPADMSYKGVHVSAGQQTLGGEEALVVVRTRNIYSSGDLGRVGTQQLFMKAFLKQCKSIGLSEMTAAMPAAFSAINTDLSAAQALSCYQELNGYDLSAINIETIPGESQMVSGQSVYLVDADAAATMLNETFRPFSDPVSVSDLQIAGN